jgi:hypothetical protein
MADPVEFVCSDSNKGEGLKARGGGAGADQAVFQVFGKTTQFADNVGGRVIAVWAKTCNRRRLDYMNLVLWNRAGALEYCE